MESVDPNDSGAKPPLSADHLVEAQESAEVSDEHGVFPAVLVILIMLGIAVAAAYSGIGGIFGTPHVGF